MIEFSFVLMIIFQEMVLAKLGIVACRMSAKVRYLMQSLRQEPSVLIIHTVRLNLMLARWLCQMNG